MRYAILIFSVISLLAVGLFMVGVERLERALVEPAPGPAVERVVVVPERARVSQVLAELAGAGLVVDEGWLTTYAEDLVAPTRLVPGEYALSSEMTPLMQLDRLRRGEVMMHTVIVPPGATAAEAVRALAGAGLGDLEALTEALEDPGLISKVGVPAPSLEGLLLPDAYTLPKGLEPEQVLGTIVKRFVGFVGPPENRATRPLYDAVRVASLIQKSGVLTREWRIYAALLYNRLDDRIPLDRPESAAYGRAQGHDAKDNPYRTDKRPGLPPTPICNPGPDALRAALTPLKTDARYMVRREDGSHYFCPDKACARAAERARQGLPPELPPALPPPAPILTPTPTPRAPPLVVPGQPLTPEPPSEQPPSERPL